MKKLLFVLLSFLVIGCSSSLDSDGDGLTDSFEDSSFNIDSPLRYNKYISDLPMIEIRMAKNKNKL